MLRRRLVRTRLLGPLILCVLTGAGLISGSAFPTASAQSAHCQPHVVVADHGDDGGHDQLRSALERVCDGGVVSIHPGTISLQQGPLVVNNQTATILPQSAMLGASHGDESPPLDTDDRSDEPAITIDGSGADEVFRIEGDLEEVRAALTLVDIEVTGGARHGILAHGGDVVLRGTTTVRANKGYGIRAHAQGAITMNDSSTVTENETGIHTFRSPVTLHDSAQVANNADAGIAGGAAPLVLNGAAAVSGNGGAGIAYTRAGVSGITLNESSRVVRNGGRGIAAVRSTVTLNGTAQVTGNRGGGVEVVRGEAVLNEFATIGNNIATVGGGVRVWSGDLTLNDAAFIHRNAALYGGGVHLTALPGEVHEGIVTLNGGGVRIARNTALLAGGGIWMSGGAIVAGGEPAVRGNMPDEIVEANNDN